MRGGGERERECSVISGAGFMACNLHEEREWKKSGVVFVFEHGAVGYPFVGRLCGRCRGLYPEKLIRVNSCIHLRIGAPLEGPRALLV